MKEMESLMAKHSDPNFDILVDMIATAKEMTVCDYGANPSEKAFNCEREEQCDDCFMVDHKKECRGCTALEHDEQPV